MSFPRQCSRPGCAHLAVATLTFVYADSTAVVGPLGRTDEPHSWDLCANHANRITVPVGWELMRSETGFGQPRDEDDLTALAEAVREVNGTGAAMAVVPDHFDMIHQPTQPAESSLPRLERPRPGRRGHLRVLPDPD